MILQHLIFHRGEFSGDLPDRYFDPAVWKQRGELTYWKPIEQGVIQTLAGLEFELGGHISSDTFFNAFFAGHWKKLAILHSLTLRLRFEGRFALVIYKHTTLGEVRTLASVELTWTSSGEFEHHFKPSDLDGSLRLSFSLRSLEEKGRLLGGAWETEDPVRHPVRLTVGINTFNRHQFVERTLRCLLDDPVLAREPMRVLVVDQSDESRLGKFVSERCRIVRQKNRGSSGGFSRVLYEALRGEDAATHVLLSDDDIELEPNSVLRAIRLAQYARKPFLLGGVLLDLYRPSEAASIGDRVIRDAAGNFSNFFSIASNLREIDVALPDYMNAISIPYNADFCGWWFCMIPAEAVATMGLPLPLFLKGDDLEYGMRGNANGFPSQTVAGIGVWHQPFYSKKVAWTQYMDDYWVYAVNSLYGGYDEVSCLFDREMMWTLEKINNYQYQEAFAKLRSMEDFLGGWDLFKKRTFPEYLVTLKKELEPFDTNSKGRPNVSAEQEAILRKKLSELLDRFRREGRPAQRSLHKHLIEATSVKAWEGYFENGNLAAL